MTNDSQDYPAMSQHTYRDDISAVLFSSCLTALGLILYNEAGLLSGGVAGLALAASYITPLSIGTAFFVLNIPFYIFAYLRRGWSFVARTFVAIALLSFLVDFINPLIIIDLASPWIASVFGGLCIGFGTLGIFRHNGSYGGAGILALHLFETRNISVGKTNLCFDLIVLTIGVINFDIRIILYSVFGAVFTNLVVGLNHKPERYIGTSIRHEFKN